MKRALSPIPNDDNEPPKKRHKPNATPPLSDCEGIRYLHSKLTLLHKS